MSLAQLARILVVDDDPAIRKIITDRLLRDLKVEREADSQAKA